LRGSIVKRSKTDRKDRNVFALGTDREAKRHQK